MKQFLTIALLSTLSLHSMAAETISNDAQVLVPGGKVLQVKKDEKKLQTPAGSVVEVEFTTSGEFKEASGDALLSGDVFEPGAGLMSLKAISEATTKAGKKLNGDWSFEKSFLHGYVYEFEGFENGKKMDYLVSAKDGKIIKEEVDH